MTSQFSQWQERVVRKAGPQSEFRLYLHTILFSGVLFAGAHAYTTWQGIPGVLNKAVADTAIIHIGLSMVLSAICYFWNFADTKIIYRKYLGLVGFAYALLHIWLSWGLFLRLLKPGQWGESWPWAAITGGVATLIFTVMALISNSFSAKILGGRVWRAVLRTGYVGLIFVAAHVYLLKGKYWVSWYQGGMESLPSLSMLVVVFMTFVVLMRLALWWHLHNQRQDAPVSKPSAKPARKVVRKRRSGVR